MMVSIAALILILSIVGYFYFRTSNHAHVLHATRHTTGIMAVQNWTTDEGLRVYFMPSPELPMVDMQLAVDAGSVRDTNILGVAYLTNSLLTQGSQDNTTDQLANKLEGLGAQLSNEARRDVAVLNLRSLTAPRFLDPTLALFTGVLQKPLFNDENVNREKKQVISEIQSLLESPDAVAKHAFYMAIYKTHPYANPIHGEMETVAQIIPKDIAQFYTAHYNPENAVLSIVGDLSIERAKEIAETVSKALPEGKKLQALPAVIDQRTAVQLQVAFPSTQTHIMQGAPALRRNDPDYFNLYVGNHILGGGSLVSRLFDKVREQRGLVYDVHSYFLPFREEGPFIIGLQTRNEEVNQALSVVDEALREFIAKGPSAEELSAAKKNITGSFNLQFSSNRTIAAQLAMLGYYELPLDYFKTFSDKINAVTSEQIHKAFEAHVHPDNLITVMVGPPPANNNKSEKK